ncbi:hypothetical protein FHS96_002603 [Sphingomonas zeicaulis]|uniref:hypothetical protein n=1 Tax=Sphingomonas zeicaulis TaxID=1632740 RepID=UPI003D256716
MGFNLRPSTVMCLAVFFLAPMEISAQEPTFYPSRGTRQEQWKYIVDLAVEAFAIKNRENSLTGIQKRDAFKKRTRTFYFAADALRDYAIQYFNTVATKESSAYLYVAFTCGLYWENSGDVWRARGWFLEADRYRAALTQQGRIIPTYNGTSIGSLLPARLARVDRLARLSGGIHPATFSLDILFSDDEHAAATEFLLKHEADISDLFGSATPNAPDDSVAKVDTP